MLVEYQTTENALQVTYKMGEDTSTLDRVVATTAMLTVLSKDKTTKDNLYGNMAVGVEW
jgi:hypothetical protein